MAFDTLTYAKKLQEAGFTSQQAEAQANALRGIVEENLASKRDIEELRKSSKQDIEGLRTSTKHDLKELEARLEYKIELVRRDIKEMESHIVIRLGALVVATATVLGVFMKLL